MSVYIYNGHPSNMDTPQIILVYVPIVYKTTPEL